MPTQTFFSRQSPPLHPFLTPLPHSGGGGRPTAHFQPMPPQPQQVRHQHSALHLLCGLWCQGHPPRSLPSAGHAPSTGQGKGGTPGLATPPGGGGTSPAASSAGLRSHRAASCGGRWGRAGGGGGGGGAWHDACVDCCLQRAAPLGLSPLTLVLALSPLPPPAAVPGGLSLPHGLDVPVWPIVTSLHSFPFPCANGAPGLSRFHYSCPGPHSGPRRWPSQNRYNI